MAELTPTQFRLTADDRAWLARLGQNMTEQLRQDAGVLRGILAGAPRRLQFTEPEMAALRDALADHLLSADQVASLPAYLTMRLEDKADLEGLADKHPGADMPALADKIRALHPADAWALWHQVQEYWAAHE